MSRAWRAFALLASLSGCGSTAAQPASPVEAAPIAPVEQPAPIAAPSPVPNASSLASAADEHAREQVAAVLRQVALLRRLVALQPVQARVIDRETMVRQVRATVREQIPPEAIRGESDFLKAFGFIPETFDYEAGVYRMIQSELAGYYDPDVRIMFLVDDLSGDDLVTTLAHELVHALQDQHYQLGPKLVFVPDGNDKQSAIQSLAEGDATSAMLDFMLAPSLRATDIPEDRLRAQMLAATSASPEFASFPYVLRASLVAPYVDGVLFVQRLRWRGGWKAVDAVWENLPATSEQILHLDKLDAREPAEIVPVPTCSSLGRGWDAVHTDVYGEQGLRIALEAWMPAARARAAAQGWGGDRAVVFHRSASNRIETSAAWHLRFDPGNPGSVDRDAVEAFSAIAAAWHATPSLTAACRQDATGRNIAMVRVGRDIAIVAGTPHPPGSGHDVGTGCALEVRWAKEIADQ